MRDTRQPHILFFAIVLGAVVLAIRDYPLVPDQVASHFDFSGAANAWMSKPVFFAFYAGLIGVAFVVEFFVPRSLAKSPTSRINLPNKEYWLAPERRAESLAYLKRQFGWYGCSFLLLEVCAMEMATRANFRTQPQLHTGPIFLLLGAFLAFNAIWMVRIFRRFSKIAID